MAPRASRPSKMCFPDVRNRGGKNSSAAHDALVPHPWRVTRWAAQHPPHKRANLGHSTRRADDARFAPAPAQRDPSQKWKISIPNALPQLRAVLPTTVATPPRDWVPPKNAAFAARAKTSGWKRCLSLGCRLRVPVAPPSAQNAGPIAGPRKKYSPPPLVPHPCPRTASKSGPMWDRSPRPRANAAQNAAEEGAGRRTNPRGRRWGKASPEIGSCAFWGPSANIRRKKKTGSAHGQANGVGRSLAIPGFCGERNAGVGRRRLAIRRLNGRACYGVVRAPRRFGVPS